MNARIAESLKRALERHRIVLWYDPEGAGAEEAAAAAGPDVIVRTVRGDEFGAKVAVHRDARRNGKWLFHIPSARPPDAENWLLDIIMQGFEFRADRVSLALQESGLEPAFRPLGEAHAAFFDRAARMAALRERLTPQDDVRDIQRKMMAVIVGGEPEIDPLLLRFLDTGPQPALIDPVDPMLGPARLTVPFWEEVSAAFGYASPAPSLRDFAAALFRAADPLEPQVRLNPHARVFLQQWKDSREHSPAFQAWSEALQEDLRVADRLQGLADPAALESADIYPAYERWTLAWLRDAFGRGEAAARLRVVLDSRRRSFWFSEHADGYEALARAITLREGLAGLELSVPSVEAGITRYAERWHRIDADYRAYCRHQRAYRHTSVLQPVTEWVERHYLNDFLLPLANLWGDRVRALPAWQSGRPEPQTRFFDRYAREILARRQKLIVVISDALRYEAAAELAERLRGENRWEAELEPAQGSLPSYTQLGMAALLPGDRRAIDAETGSVTLDGRPTQGTSARAAILGALPDIRATAVQATDFLQMGTKTEARALIREHDAVYIFHNVIDKTGDDIGTEARTAEAVEDALEEIIRILNKAYSANATRFIVTADHGFLFQHAEADAGDDRPLPPAREWLYRSRRFALGRGIAADGSVKVFTAAQLGLDGDWEAAFPLGLGRFPVQGSGKRYTHGGISLQEIVVPILRARKTRVDDVSPVEVEILRAPERITTGTLSLALYQEQPVSDKVLARTLRVGVFAPDGAALSEVRTVEFTSTDEDPRHREQTLTLTLSRTADGYANQEVEIRLEGTAPGTSQTVRYKATRVMLQKRFTSDFDD